LDTPEDYEVIKQLLEHFASIGKPIDYTLDDICDFFESHPDVPAINTVRAAKTTSLTVNTEIDWSNYTKTPLVTVYITNHNYGKYIKQAIDSVLSQKFRHFEIIIIDDGSTDDSKNTIETYRNDPKVTIVYQENKGLNVTCNIALKLSRGKYIMRLDADDCLDENALLVMTDMLEREEELEMVFPDYYLVDEKGDIISQQRRHDFREVKLLDQPAHGACTMIRRKTLIEVGGYGEDFGCQDGYELWLKFIKTHKVSNVSLPLFHYRQHDKNLTANKHAILNTRHNIIKRHVQEYDVANRNHLCVVPIRSSRDELPLAVRPFAGTTLLDLTIKQIQQTENVWHTIITSSDERILECAKKYESQSVTTDKRPEALCAVNTHIEDTIDYLLDTYSKLGESETITIVNYEYPLRKPFYIDKIINTLYLFDTDAAVAVEQKDANFYFHRGVGLVPFDTNRELRLERDFVYEETGGLHSIKYEAYIKHHDMLPGVVSHIILDELSTKRVRSELDFNVLEHIYTKNFS
jgi:glycosyltransferase involved in cell wall biosynthesis